MESWFRNIIEKIECDYKGVEIHIWWIKWSLKVGIYEEAFTADFADQSLMVVPECLLLGWNFPFLYHFRNQYRVPGQRRVPVLEETLPVKGESNLICEGKAGRNCADHNIPVLSSKDSEIEPKGQVKNTKIISWCQ